jgi:hypothetical protein
MADLKPRQYKRLGRIEERNPERAARVADRMEKRASRTERGKAIASNAEEKRTGGRAIGRGEAMTRQAFNSRSESLKRDAVKTMTEKGRTSSGAKPVNVVRGKVNRPDTPLAMTPEPYSDFVKSK